MSEKVKSNIFDIAVPECLCLNTKTTDLLGTVIKMLENRFTAAMFKNGRKRFPGLHFRWPHIQLFLYLYALRLCHISCLYAQLIYIIIGLATTQVRPIFGSNIKSTANLEKHREACGNQFWTEDG